MSKDRRNISIDPEVNNAIDPGDTFSDLVNEWTRQYYLEGNFYNVEKAFLQQMLEQVEDSRDMMHEQVDEMHDELAGELEAKIDHVDTVGYDEKQQTGSDAKWQEAFNVLEGAARDPTNPAIKNWAGKLNVSPDELIEQLRKEHGEAVSSEPNLRSV
jgi:hypothetical protein